MITLDLLQNLLYLDRDFISSYYEVVTGEAATTHFTHQEGKKAGAAIPIFSAELSAVEIKSYNVSSLQMLSRVIQPLDEYPVLDLQSLPGTTQTAYGWVSGRLSAAVTKRTLQTKGEEKVLAEDRYFTLRTSEEPSLALITSESNFQSGINALTRLQSTILKDFSLHVRAFVRVLPSSTHVGHLVTVPLVILEAREGGA